MSASEHEAQRRFIELQSVVRICSHVSSSAHLEASPKYSSYRRPFYITCAQRCSCSRASIVNFSFPSTVATPDWWPGDLIACSLLLNSLSQRASGEIDTSVSVPDRPDLPFGLLQLAEGIDPVVE